VDSNRKSLVASGFVLLTSLSDYQNLVCADTAAQGFLALESYLKALGYEATLETDIISFVGPVYIKFNTQKSRIISIPYTGKYHGVLVSCQSLQDESINGTYGHLPLDLFG